MNQICERNNPFKIVNGILKKYHGTNSSVIIPDGVKKIGEEAFYACRLLKSITIPDTVTEIGNVAFCGCLFESLCIPNKVTKICDGAFGFCFALKSVMIPVSVMEIGRGAFFECPLLSEINYAGTIEQWKAVKKGRTWRLHTLAKFVQCTDGIVRLPQFYIKKVCLKNISVRSRQSLFPIM
ncbi:MAG: leucine-rich repeat domain-containing protein [Spirochaetaceae bacterium]|nr:leucine-rich repeat domain-containing protein [Spirochaetaceae bacterium]